MKTEQFQDYLARLFPPGLSESGERKLARTVTFAVTDACSLRCTYCYQGVKSHHVMSFETAKKFTDLVLRGDKP